MKFEFKTPKELKFFEQTKTKLIAVIYEDDDIEKKYPDYYVLSPHETKNDVLQKFDYDKNKKYCFVVLKNSDFTEGRGPMKSIVFLFRKQKQKNMLLLKVVFMEVNSIGKKILEMIFTVRCTTQFTIMDMTLRKWKFCKFFCNFGVL